MRWKAMLLVMAAVTAFVVPMERVAGVDDRPICEITADWVEANRHALPTTLEGFAEYTPAYRRAIAGALPDELRTKLWVEQLEQYAASADLSDDQVRFIGRVVNELEADLVSRSREDVDKVVVRGLAEEAAELFDPTALHTTFSLLGPVEDMSVFDREDCGCSTYAFGCLSVGLECSQGAEDCRHVYECGMLGFDYCDGLCELEN